MAQLERDTTYTPRHAAAHKTQRNGHSTWIVPAVLLGLCVLVYGVGVIAFSSLFYPGETIAGIDVSLLSAEDAAVRVESRADDFSVHVSGKEFSWSYTPTSDELPFDVEARAQNMLSAHDSYLWPVHVMQSFIASTSGNLGNSVLSIDASSALKRATEVELNSSFDGIELTGELKDAIAAYNESRTNTFDVASAFDEAVECFSAEKAKANVKVDEESVRAAVYVALSELTELVELDESYFDAFETNVSDEQLITFCDEANALIAHTITLTMEDDIVTTIDADQFAQWIVFGEDYTASLDSEAVRTWASALAADTLTTVGTTRTYTREDGKEISVSGGTWGWEVDTDLLVEQIVSAVDTEGDTTIAIPCSSTADIFSAQGARDWGAYIDIDLTEQHAYYYDAQGTLLWDSGIISGNPSAGHSTPTGVYRMKTPLRNTNLRGEIDPETGEPEYISFVSYWMPFVGNSIGLHDASWQATSSFSNPRAYTWTGSHGCVNLPVQKAQDLYGIVYEGLCVVVHQ